jgi:glycosyltransferase involved in cell wall biosynthesis
LLDRQSHKKICFVVSSAMTVNAFLQEPIRRLSENNQVFVIANLNPGETLPCISAPGRLIPVRIERKISPWRDLLALLKMIQVFRQHRFDVVHSVTPKAGLLAMTAALVAGISTRIHTFTGQVWATRQGLSRLIFKNVDRLIASFASHVLVDSFSQRNFLLDQGVVSAGKSRVLHQGSVSGVDLQRFKPNLIARGEIRRNLGISEQDLVFLFIGRLNRDKGVLDLAVAFPIVFARYPGVHLLVVGPDEEDIRTEMEARMGACRSHVHFVGFAGNPEDYMASADVLCLPSYREGFGNVVIEAAAVGIPTLGSRIYGIVDAVVDDETGLLFEPRDVDSLTASLNALAADPSRREQLGRQARTRVLCDFSCERLAQAWIEFYQGLE